MNVELVLDELARSSDRRDELGDEVELTVRPGGEAVEGHELLDDDLAHRARH